MIEPGSYALERPSFSEVASAVGAFSNTGGGRILLGVKADGRVIGAPEWDTSKLEDQLLLAVSPRPQLSLVHKVIGEKSIILIDVPMGTEQPYVVGDRIFVWRGGMVLAATPDEISSMIIGRAEHGRRWEREPALGATIRDLDERELFVTIERGLARSIGESKHILEPVELLNSLNLADGEQLHNAAIVLFARNPSRSMPQTRVKLASFGDLQRTTYIDNRVAEGNLFALFKEITTFFERHISIRSSFKEYTRHDQGTVPNFVIREAVMNALVHRDYQQANANVMIAIYPDRFEIWNPGSLPDGISAEMLPRARVSRPHNPDIANVAFVRGMVEQWGSGTRRIMTECRRAGLPEPEWEEIGGGVRITVYMSPTRAPLSDESLSERSRLFLRESFPGQRISLENYHHLYGRDASERTARRDLETLVEFGYLEKTGERPGMYTRTDRISAR